MNIIVTGNIGCGKSTVIKELQKALPEYQFYSVDTMVHDMYNNPDFQNFLTREFNTINRAEVSDLVFQNPEKKALIEKESVRFLANVLRAALKTYKAVVEFPLFHEMGGKAIYGKDLLTIAITCTDDVQIERIKSRDNFSDDKIAKIRASQFSTDLKAALSDIVFPNNGGNIFSAIKHLAMDIRVRDLEERANSFFCNKDAWVKIKAAYTEPHRHYHSLEHLAAMFVHFDQHRHNIPHPFEVELAIWFHDFVYDTDLEQYSENEANSVKAMIDITSNLYDPFAAKAWIKPKPEKIIMAAEFILSTKGHKVKAPSVMADNLARLSNEYFLDIDLSILGTETSTCDEFDERIRKEFVQFSDGQFRAGRHQAMSDFRKRPFVYYTEAFRAAYESNAQHNLSNILLKWS